MSTELFGSFLVIAAEPCPDVKAVIAAATGIKKAFELMTNSPVTSLNFCARTACIYIPIQLQAKGEPLGKHSGLEIFNKFKYL